jgi:general L-amino acid transport system substrate-binding protein
VQILSGGARTVAMLAACLLLSATAGAQSRLELVRQRGVLGCGIAPGVVGFARVDDRGRYTGFDVDICRALATAIFGTPDKVRFIQAASVENFVRSADIDVVSRRLTWTLPREGLGLLFGPVTFYDGQGFLVPRKRGIATVRQLSKARICVQPGVHAFNLDAYSRSHKIAFTPVHLRSLEQAEDELAAGRCDALTADVSMLGSVRSLMRSGANFDILKEQISKEPMGQVVRQGDDQFFSILRWTVFALIAAEELGVTSANAASSTASADLDVQRLLGVVPGNGRALGLDEKWAYNVIRAVGNYGEIFERNVGQGSPIGFERGLNALWTGGGLMYAPLVRP